MGHKDARFITQFIDTYKSFRPDVWYYNGGEKPVREVERFMKEIFLNQILFFCSVDSQ